MACTRHSAHNESHPSKVDALELLATAPGKSTAPILALPHGLNPLYGHRPRRACSCVGALLRQAFLAQQIDRLHGDTTPFAWAAVGRGEQTEGNTAHQRRPQYKDEANRSGAGGSGLRGIRPDRKNPAEAGLENRGDSGHRGVKEVRRRTEFERRSRRHRPRHRFFHRFQHEHSSDQS